MKKPEFRDVVYESFFVGGYLAAADNGRVTKALIDDHRVFYQSMDQGTPLVAFCHFIDTYWGDRKEFIAALDDKSLGPIVRLIYYVRNAFIHCAWEVDEMDKQNQRDAILEAAVGDQLHHKAPHFSLTVDEGGRVHVEGLMSICMAIADSVPD